MQKKKKRFDILSVKKDMLAKLVYKNLFINLACQNINRM